MSIALKDLTKKSRWKLLNDVPFYPIVAQRWSIQVQNSTEMVPSGTEFTVPDKRESGEFGDHVYNRELQKYEFTWEKSGVYFFVEVHGKKGIMFFNDIKNSIEVLEKPPEISYHIQDTSTGKFYVCEVFRPDDIKKNETCTEHPCTLFYRENESSTVKIRWAKTPGSSKKFKDIGMLKMRILMISGYFNGMGNEMDSYYPLKSIPETWKIVQYDKSTDTSTVLEFDLEQYRQDSFKLRGITLKFGSACREMYNGLNKKDLVNKYPYFILFNAGDVNSTANTELMMDVNNPVLESTGKDYCNQAGANYVIKDTEIAMVKSCIAKGMKKVLRADSICIAVDNEADAWSVGLGYNGGLTWKIMNMSTLQEMVKS